MLPLTPASERILCESVGDNNEEVGESGSSYLRPLRHCMYLLGLPITKIDDVPDNKQVLIHLIQRYSNLLAINSSKRKIPTYGVKSLFKVKLMKYRLNIRVV